MTQLRKVHILDSDGNPLKAVSPSTPALQSAIQDTYGNALEAVSGSVPVLKVALHDGSGNPIESLSGAIDVHEADVHNIPINDFLHRHTGTQTTLASAVTAGDTQITVASATGFAVGDLIHLGSTLQYLEPRHPIITAIAGVVITLDGPVDRAYANGTDVIQAIADMSSVAGTLASPSIYRYYPGDGRVEHVLRILISMTHGAASADNLFGSLTALTNGVHFRANISGQYGTFTNWKDNADIKLDMFDVEYSDKAGPSLYGTNARGSFSRIGVAVRLDSAAGDFLEVLVQDDLTTMNSFRIKAQGHVEGA